MHHHTLPKNNEYLWSWVEQPVTSQCSAWSTDLRTAYARKKSHTSYHWSCFSKKLLEQVWFLQILLCVFRSLRRSTAGIKRELLGCWAGWWDTEWQKQDTGACSPTPRVKLNKWRRIKNSLQQKNKELFIYSYLSIIVIATVRCFRW